MFWGILGSDAAKDVRLGVSKVCLSNISNWILTEFVQLHP